MVYLSLVVNANLPAPTFVLTFVDEPSSTTSSVTGLCSDAGSDYSTVYNWLTATFPQLNGYVLIKSDISFHIGNHAMYMGGRVRLNWVI